MATNFTDVAAEAAYMSSIKVQNYHGEIYNTIVNTTAAAIGTADNVTYICPIPWYARLIDISVIWGGASKYSTKPTGKLYVRSMRGKNARTSSDLATLEYGQIFGTTNDYAAAVDASGTANHKTLAGTTLANNNTTEISATASAFSISTTTAHTDGQVETVQIHLLTRTHTLAECYSYRKNITRGSSTEISVTYADNMKDEAKEHLGMLTLVNPAGVTETDGPCAIRVSYVAPAPSAVSLGKIIR